MANRRILGIAIGVILAAYAIGGLSRINFNVDILRLLPAHLPQVKGLSLFLEHFSQPGELIITLEGENPDATRSTALSLAELLTAQPELVSRAVASPPWETDPLGLAELLALLLINQPPDQAAALAARLSPDQTPDVLADTLATLANSFSPAEIALLSYDPYQLTTRLAGGVFSEDTLSEFSSADGTFRVVYVQAAQPFANYVEAGEWIAAIRVITASWQQDHDVTVGFTGEPAFLSEISRSMQWDMTSSGVVTLAAIALIFWFCYRSLRPLLFLQLMLALIFVLSLATAGYFLSDLTVIGAGFASVMIGLSVDYGYFVHARSLTHRGPVRDLRRNCFQNIAWTSTTTAAAFFALNLSSLPGLSQLGNLVAIGVVIGAIVMLGIFAPLAMHTRDKVEMQAPRFFERLFEARRFSTIGAWLTLALVGLLLGTLIVKGPPKMDFSARVFRPRASEAYPVMDRLSQKLTSSDHSLSLVVTGSNETDVADRLRELESKLVDAVNRGDATSYQSPLPLWPSEKNQAANLRTLSPLADDLPRLRESALAAGFTPEAFILTEAVLNQLGAWQGQPVPIWPVNATSEWVLRRIVSHQPGSSLAMGLVDAVPGREDALTQSLTSENVHLASWSQLSRELARTIPPEFIRVILGLSAVILLILAFGFRSFKAVLLFTATTGLVLACLAGAMSLLGMTWSFFNLAAILLLLGTGTDYSILLLLALRRNGGDAAAAQRELGLVIALCCSSAAIGFGTIAWANNAGLAALGQTCALGLVIDALISLFLLPRAWAWLHRREPTPALGQ